MQKNCQLKSQCIPWSIAVDLLQAHKHLEFSFRTAVGPKKQYPLVYCCRLMNCQNRRYKLNKVNQKNVLNPLWIKNNNLDMESPTVFIVFIRTCAHHRGCYVPRTFYSIVTPKSFQCFIAFLLVDNWHLGL